MPNDSRFETSIFERLVHVVSRFSGDAGLAEATQAVVHSARLQALTTLRAPEHLSTLITTPLWAALYIALNPGSGFAAFGAALIGIWQITINVAAGVIENEKWQGTLELALSAALPYWCILLGRVAAFVPLFVVVSAEAVLTNWVLTGSFPVVRGPGFIAAAFLLASFGAIATAVLLGPLFLRVKNGPVISSALSFPMLLLGGLALPPEDMGEPWHALSRVFFLSWITDLIREAQTATAPWPTLWATTIAVLVLGTASVCLGAIILGRTERLMLRRGTREFIG